MRVAVRVDPSRILLLDAGEIYHVRAEGHETLVRTARRRLFRSDRTLAEWETLLGRPGGSFFRIHRSLLVNLDRVREIRLREGDPNDWEVKLDPPVNAVLPVARSRIRALREAIGL